MLGDMDDLEVVAPEDVKACHIPGMKLFKFTYIGTMKLTRLAQARTDRLEKEMC